MRDQNHSNSHCAFECQANPTRLIFFFFCLPDLCTVTQSHFATPILLSHIGHISPFNLHLSEPYSRNYTPPPPLSLSPSRCEMDPANTKSWRKSLSTALRMVTIDLNKVTLWSPPVEKALKWVQLLGLSISNHCLPFECGKWGLDSLMKKCFGNNWL